VQVFPEPSWSTARTALLIVTMLGILIALVAWSLERYWVIVPALAPLGIMVGLQTRDARRTRRIADRLNSGCCLSCGYDLRVPADRCPECGNATAVRIVELDGGAAVD